MGGCGPVLLRLQRERPQVADAAAWHSQSRGVSDGHFAAEKPAGGGGERSAAVDDNRAVSAGGRLGRNKGSAIHIRLIQSRPASTWLPSPAISGNIDPGAIVVGRPTPGIARGPGISETWVIAPHPVHEGVPAGTGKVRLPHHAVARHVAEAAVVVQVAAAVG